MPFDLAIFDLDNTLYAADAGVFARMDERMTAFIQAELGIEREAADRLRVEYWRRYGSTLRGLALHHGLEPEPFLAHVHDVGAEDMLAPDPALDAALSRIRCRKVIHTNGILEHAERVLAALGVRHHFARIYDIRFNDYRPKPDRDTLAAVLAAEGASPARTLVVDDMAENLLTARELGCKTVLIHHEPDGRWDWHLPRVHDLPAHLPAQAVRP
ncbi:MAG: pyrimidine 5'-nucleotidase [Mariprofundaceae bacterium]